MGDGSQWVAGDLPLGLRDDTFLMLINLRLRSRAVNACNDISSRKITLAFGT
jgi:hypothetical protein